jgi:hypothetical protein
MADTAETIGNALAELLDKKRGPATKKFVVLQRGYNGERMVYQDDDKKKCQKVVDEHPARRMISNGG